MKNPRVTLRLPDRELKGCALEQLDSASGISGLATFLGSLHTMPIAGTSCPVCGWTETQLEQTGLLGCSLCYSTFEAKISKMIS